MKQIETTGATREEAIQKALEELGVEMADVTNIEVIDEGSKGFLGLGSRPVKVRVTVEKDLPEKPQKSHNKAGTKEEKQSRTQTTKQVFQKQEKEADKKYARPVAQSTSKVKSKQETIQEKPVMNTEPSTNGTNENVQESESRVTITEAQGSEASALLCEMLKKMGIEATVKFVRTEDGVPKLEIDSQDGALLIGRKGSHLETLQFLINRMFFGLEEGDNSEKFVVDTENYLARRKESLRQMAINLAERARKTGRKVKLSPMPPHERRIIHVTLQNDNSVETFSLGKGDNRYVVIAPKVRRYDRRTPKDTRNRRGYKNQRHDNRYSNRPQNRRGNRRDYKPNWRRGRTDRSPYGDDIEPGQVSE